MKLKIFTILLALIATLFIASCSGDDDNPVNPNEKPEPQQPNVQTVQLPQSVANSSDPHAAQAMGMAAMANSFSGYASFFSPPSGAKALPKTADNGSWEYSWNDGTLVVTLYYTEDAEGYSWKVVLNGTEPNDNIVYTNWTMLEATQTADGSNGTMILYEDNSTEIAFKITWTKDSNGNVYMEYTSYGENGTMIKIQANADQSGWMEIYYNRNGQYVISMKISWTSAGGEWWEYDYQGNETDHGSF